MAWSRLGGPWLTVQSLYGHSLHQYANPLLTHGKALLTKPAAQHNCTCKRELEIKRFYTHHRLLVRLRDWLQQRVSTASVHIEQLRLPGHWPTSTGLLRLKLFTCGGFSKDGRMHPIASYRDNKALISDLSCVCILILQAWRGSYMLENFLDISRIRHISNDPYSSPTPLTLSYIDSKYAL